MAEKSDWRICYARVIGSSHQRTGLPCQDYCGCEVLSQNPNTTVLMFAADGAGSATNSLEGAQLVCQSFLEHFRERISGDVNVADVDIHDCEDWIAIARDALKAQAAIEGLEVRDFACTFLGAIFSDSAAAFLQIGDGAIVVSCPEDQDEYDIVFWPENGEFANTTFFISGEDAEQHLQFSNVKNPPYEIAILTDGLQRLALNMANKTAHSPFFRNVFGPLRRQKNGLSSQLCDELDRFLQSEPVLDRTDDDKSLVLVTRVSIDEVAPDSPN